MSEVARITLSLGRKRLRPIKITFVPLVDCFIILLIFFMLQSSFVAPHGVALAHEEQERMQAGTTSGESPVLYVELHKDGGLWVDGERCEGLGGLGRTLAQGQRRVKPAIIASDPGVPLQRAVDVIDVLSARGYSKVSLREAQQFR